MPRRSATFIYKVAGFKDLMAEPYVEMARDYFYDIIIGVVILLVGFVIGILAKKFTYRVFKEVGLNRIMSNVGITYDLERMVSSIISYVIYLFSMVVFLDRLGIRSMVLYLIAGGLLALLILTLLVGLKDVIPNVVGWIYVQKKGVIKEGKLLEVREIVGVVERVGYLETEIKTKEGDLLYVPNSLFLKSKFKIRQ